VIKAWEKGCFMYPISLQRLFQASFNSFGNNQLNDIAVFRLSSWVGSYSKHAFLRRDPFINERRLDQEPSVWKVIRVLHLVRSDRCQPLADVNSTVNRSILVRIAHREEQSHKRVARPIKKPVVQPMVLGNNHPIDVASGTGSQKRG